jgi:AcrR family transcriptional regulator
MVESAAVLLAMRGLDGTAFSDVLARSGAPRGSIYHHFPEGKDQLVEAAMRLAGDRAIGVLEPLRGAPPRDVTAAFLDLWRAVLDRSTLRAGCAVLAVTVATDSSDLLDRAAAIFRAWRTALAELYVEGGVEPGVAARLAMTVIAATEGAVVVSRAERSMDPFELVAEELLVATPESAGSPASEPPSSRLPTSASSPGERRSVKGG